MDWTRAALKDAAKQEMKKAMKYYVIGALLIFVISLASVIPAIIFSFVEIWALYTITLFAAIILVLYPITVGWAACYVRAPHGERDLGNLFMVFRSGKYWQVVGAMLRCSVVIFLWSLLLVIPGIIKSYQYMMVPFILCESPGVSGKEAMQISRQMTDGQKGRMFVLDLSFIGWELLALIPIWILMGILSFMAIGAYTGATILIMVILYLISIAALLVVGIYHEATLAQLYFIMRDKFFKQQPQSDSPQQPYNGLDPKYQPPAR